MAHHVFQRGRVALQDWQFLLLFLTFAGPAVVHDATFYLASNMSYQALRGSTFVAIVDVHRGSFTGHMEQHESEG
jgi:hypothetical protein